MFSLHENSTIDVQQCLQIVFLPRKTILLFIYHNRRALIPVGKAQRPHDAPGHGDRCPDLAPVPK